MLCSRPFHCKIKAGLLSATQHKWILCAYAKHAWSYVKLEAAGGKSCVPGGTYSILGKVMNRINPEVDTYLSHLKQWQDESRNLRRIILDCQLTEELKWRQPCYTIDGSNVVIIQGFKEYCAVMFFKGALLKDEDGVLVAPGKSQAGRQIRFTNLREIMAMEPLLKAYIHEAIDVEKAGLKVKLKETSDFEKPEEFQAYLDNDPALKTAFEALTPGRQRNYLHYFSEAKQSKTRESRVEKCIPRILEGKGLNDS